MESHLGKRSRTLDNPRYDGHYAHSSPARGRTRTRSHPSAQNPTPFSVSLADIPTDMLGVFRAKSFDLDNINDWTSTGPQQMFSHTFSVSSETQAVKGSNPIEFYHWQHCDFYSRDLAMCDNVSFCSSPSQYSTSTTFPPDSHTGSSSSTFTPTSSVPSTPLISSVPLPHDICCSDSDAQIYNNEELVNPQLSDVSAFYGHHSDVEPLIYGGKDPDNDLCHTLPALSNSMLFSPPLHMPDSYMHAPNCLGLTGLPSDYDNYRPGFVSSDMRQPEEDYTSILDRPFMPRPQFPLFSYAQNLEEFVNSSDEPPMHSWQ